MSKFYTSNNDVCDSRFERDMVQSLIDQGRWYEFHPEHRDFVMPVRGGFCKDCDSNNVAKGVLYEPDVVLKSGLIVEIKGKFVAPIRNRMAQFIKQWPGPMAFVFMANNKLNKQSRTRYVDWAQKRGVLCAMREIPKHWDNKFTNAQGQTWVQNEETGLWQWSAI